jgi:hypothetical protein
MHDEDEELEAGFKMNDDLDGDEPLDLPEEINDFGLDEEDPDKDH